MPRFHQFLFTTALVGLSWLAMMAVHELGHVLGAMATGGEVERVVLHPLAISRTDVSPNPNPSVVVWLGPVVGCVIPVAGWLIVPRRLTVAAKTTQFFAGFCLVANGAYIGIGSFDGVGDCGEMLRTGSPQWALIGFGAVATTVGFVLWHRLGSLRDFLRNPALVTAKSAYLTLCILLAVIVGEFAWFSDK